MDVVLIVVDTHEQPIFAMDAPRLNVFKVISDCYNQSR